MVNANALHPPVPGFSLDGSLALDFANTLSRRGTPEPRERLDSYSSLVEWALAAQLIGPAEATRLRDKAKARPAEAERTLRRAIRLREAIYGIFHAFGRGGQPAPADLEQLNQSLGEGMGRRHLRASPAGEGYCWAWEEEPEGLDWVIWPVAYHAAELTTTDDLHRVRECAADDCAWLFYDASRNRSRRWCDMNSCGNRVKARRHYARRHEERDSPPRS